MVGSRSSYPHKLSTLRPMSESQIRLVMEKFAALRTELVDRAFVLECRGRLDAADEAITISAQLAEILEELEIPRLEAGLGFDELAG